MNPTDHDDENTTTDTTPAVGPAGDLATVHHLPARPEGGPAIEGEIVSEEEWRLYTDQQAQRAWRYAEYRRQGALVVKATRTAVTHDKTVATAKFAGRHAAYVFGGAGIVAKRVWEAKTNSRYERLLRAAEARGDGEELKHWEERAELAKEKRHRRAMDWLDAPVKIGKGLLLAVLVSIVVLFGIGCLLALSFKDVSMIGAPFGAVTDVIRWVTIAISVTWGPFLLAAPWIGLAALHHIGRRAEAHPGWLARTGAGTDATALVTADGIVTALRHLPIPKLKKAFKKEEWVPRFELTPIREGQGAFRGFRAIFDLPMGVTPKMIADPREVLAKNLNRNPVEVWASDYGREKGGKAGYLNLYVADSGVMDKPTPEYPLLHEGTRRLRRSPDRDHPARRRRVHPDQRVQRGVRRPAWPGKVQRGPGHGPRGGAGPAGRDPGPRVRHERRLRRLRTAAVELPEGGRPPSTSSPPWTTWTSCTPKSGAGRGGWLNSGPRS